ncbi:MAG: sulfite exporter TauE/SafE family protein, partial [Gammaproteobacteria bacterium]|nr:sulfite exporter TauE/SafE family protein [Gammaproteobacteria bacterium]
ALALQGNSLLTTQLSIVSAAAVIPAAVGMIAGQRIRSRLSEERFRHVFFIAILILGAYIIATAAFGAR